jgi:uncharacterized protein (DUF58 family)
VNLSLRQHLSEGERAGLRYALGLPRRAPVGMAGGALSLHAGSSLELQDHRDYQPGDDLRHIDWNMYARSDQLIIKLFREEVMPHVDLVLDGSRSMSLPDSQKARAALALAGFFTAAAANAGQSHRAWLLGDRLQPVGNGSGPPSEWEGIDYTAQGDPLEALAQGPRWRPHGIRILLSDLLWLGEPLRALQYLSERAAVTLVVQVLAAEDVNPGPQGHLQLVDSESGETREVLLDEVMRRRYRTALERHQQSWHQACKQTGAIFTTLVAEQLLQDWRLDELVAAEVLRVI